MSETIISTSSSASKSSGQQSEVRRDPANQSRRTKWKIARYCITVLIFTSFTLLYKTYNNLMPPLTFDIVDRAPRIRTVHQSNVGVEAKNENMPPLSPIVSHSRGDGEQCTFCEGGISLPGDFVVPQTHGNTCHSIKLLANGGVTSVQCAAIQKEEMVCCPENGTIPVLQNLNSPTSLPVTLSTSQDSDYDAESESCLRPRRIRKAKSQILQPPFINLGMPKMGSSSLHSYFQCGGYESVHLICAKKKLCAKCMESAIKAGRSPLSISQCTNETIDAYTQIDRGPEYLPQVNYLNEIVDRVPNATFILTFRDIKNWYMSLTHW